jgi:hypothetical protein
MNDAHRISDNSIKNIEWISEQRKHPYPWPLLNTRRAVRSIRDSYGDISNTLFERCGDPWSELPVTMSSYLTQIIDGALR